MNVIIGTCLSFGTGGVKSYMLTLNNALKSVGQSAEIVSPDEMNLKIRIKTAIKVFWNKDRGRIKLTNERKSSSGYKTNLLLKTNKFDFIHAQDVLYANSVLNFGVPIVLTVHGPYSREAIMQNKNSKRYYSFIIDQEKTAYERVDHIIAVDTGQKEIIVNDYGIDPDKITVILNSVDPDYFSPKANDETLTKDISYYLVPRRLVPKNGVKVAIEAFSLLKNISDQLWIAGDGPEIEMLNTIAQKHGLDNKVRFLGSIDTRDEMRNLLQNAKGIIIPSIPVNGVVEASSIAALEGMSVGKAVFASNIGGLAEIINHNENGILFAPGDHIDLAKKIQEVNLDQNALRTIGGNARQSIIRNNSSISWAKKVVGVYEQISKP